MLEYPLLSIVVILPFSVVLVFAVLELIINVILRYFSFDWDNVTMTTCQSDD